MASATARLVHTFAPGAATYGAARRQRRALSAGAAATTPGDDVAWLGSRFAAGAEQQAQELSMVALKDRLASDSAAEHAAFVRRLDALAAEERDRAAAAAASHGRDSLAAQVRRACDTVQDGLVERDTEVRLLLLAALCGEHLLLIGKPGTAKSQLGRRLSSLVAGRFFERQLTSFSVPEELFGPLALRELENDRYVRKTERYLPDADVAFVDEIFKANSSILNSLLTLLNERAYDNGSRRCPVPLVCLIGASNELPESEELDALYDRFMIRKEVTQVSDAGLRELLSTPAAATAPHGTRTDDKLFTAASLQKVRDGAAGVVVPDAVQAMLADLRGWLQTCGTYVSDRRLTKVVSLLRVAAFVNGRAAVALHDCLLLEHVMWSRPEQAPALREWLLEHALPKPAVVTDDLNAAMDKTFLELCRIACSEVNPSERGAALQAQLTLVRQGLESAALGAALQKAQTAPALAQSVWFTAKDASAAAGVLSHAAAACCEEALALLREVLAMECALRAHAPPHAVALLLPGRWLALAKSAREQALSVESRLRTAIPPCGHRIARSYCATCLDGMGLLQTEPRRPSIHSPDPRRKGSTV